MFAAPHAESSVAPGRRVLHHLLQQLFGSSLSALLLETHYVAARLLDLHAQEEEPSSSSSRSSAEEAAVQRDVALCLRGWLLALDAIGREALTAVEAQDADGSSQSIELTLLQAALGTRPAAAAAAAAALQREQTAGRSGAAAGMGERKGVCCMPACGDDAAAAAAAAATTCGCDGCVLLSRVRALSLGEAVVQLLFHILTYYERATSAAASAARQEQHSAGSGNTGVFYTSPWMYKGTEAEATNSKVSRHWDRASAAAARAAPSGTAGSEGRSNSGLLQQFPLLQFGWEDLGEPFLWLLAARVYSLLLLAAPRKSPVGIGFRIG